RRKMPKIPPPKIIFFSGPLGSFSFFKKFTLPSFLKRGCFHLFIHFTPVHLSSSQRAIHHYSCRQICGQGNITCLAPLELPCYILVSCLMCQTLYQTNYQLHPILLDQRPKLLLSA